MPEYINPNNHPVHLTGPNGEMIKVASRQKIILSEYYDRYRKRGFIKLVAGIQHRELPSQQNKMHAQVRLRIDENKRKRQETANNTSKPLEPRERKKGIVRSIFVKEKQKLPDSKPIVGRVTNTDGNNIIAESLEIGYPISNNIGVGILSYNRKACLERLINSIRKYTDLNKTTVFISDDNSQNADLLEYLDQLADSNEFIIIRNEERLGIAGNTNRLLGCLSRFKNCILLNDDTEIKNHGWDEFYFAAMQKSKMHHFIYRQSGVYGANRGNPVIINSVECLYCEDKPHGSILAYTNMAFRKIGYFDESFGMYGMEHVDWSRRVYESGLQRQGYYDVSGSDKYFTIHNEISVMDDRVEKLRSARDIYNAKYDKSIDNYFVDKSNKITLPHISFVIPYRNIDRTGAVETIINNVRSQRFPMIDIILIEHDTNSRVDTTKLEPIEHALIDSGAELFNKSKAFNFGVSKVKSESVILQDADILLRADYTSQVYNILKHYKSCHIGNYVVYADEPSTRTIINKQQVSRDIHLNRVVGYFEGGSLACEAAEYWRCGAYNEDFWGYGCEDCDFYARMSSDEKTYYGIRSAVFLHLHHGRVDGWDSHHKRNKALEQSLSSKSMPERIRLQYDQLDKLGYSEKIKNCNLKAIK